ncbi:MAG: ABC transporter permease [Actinobacteria bacterium]|nr:ABC transporter permease [Actinomycetota bacterium]
MNARHVGAQWRVELLLTLRRGESVLLTFLIPALLLGFFSLVDVLPRVPGTTDPVDSLAPGILALAVMSTAMVSLAIATGFERQQGVLKRLGATPLTRRELLVAKILAVVSVEVLQVGLLIVEGVALGWRPPADGLVVAAAALLLATVGFAGVGMLMAGTLPALTTLAAANGLYLVLLLLGGMVVPLSRLPGPVATVARALPSGALAAATEGALARSGVPAWAWGVLAVWAVVGPAVAAARFRWEA